MDVKCTCGHYEEKHGILWVPPVSEGLIRMTIKDSNYDGFSVAACFLSEGDVHLINS